MAAINDLRLIYELYDNIAIIDKDLNLLFVGSALKQILSENKIETDLKDVSSNLSFSPLSRFFKQTVLSVLNSMQPEEIKLDISGIEFLIIPSIDGVLLGLKEKISKICKIEFELNNRIKELECLYNITKEYYAGETIDEFLERCIKHIESGFPSPSDTFVNIYFGRNEFGNTQWDIKQITNVLISGIYLNEKKCGEIKVFIRNAKDSFSAEKKLLDEIAGKISKIIEKEEENRILERQQEILKAKNEALIKMTGECYKKGENLKTFFRAITNKIVVIDKNFDIIMSNKDDIGDSGKCYNKLFGLDRKCESCPAETTFNLAQDAFCEREYNGQFFMLQSYPILGPDNNTERVLEVIRDITEQKTIEDQLIQSYKLASLGKLVAGVAHEINNPNTFILGNLKIVQEAFQDIIPLLDKFHSENNDLKIARLNYELFKENITILINDMINGANRTKKIVGDLRNFAKKDESGLTDIVDINEIIRNSLSLTQKHIKKYARLELELGENIPNFTGNTYKLEQVLVNLTMNASEAIEPLDDSSDGLIKIKTWYEKQHDEVLLCVTDNGIGMDESVLKNIFDPFFTTKRNKGGTGLGLSITYGIIKDHNGKIEVSSKPGIGTTFIVRFPVK